jgi:hypothetical protein
VAFELAADEEEDDALLPLPMVTVLAVPYPIVPLTSWVVASVRFRTGCKLVESLGLADDADADVDESEDATTTAIPPPTMTTAAPMANQRAVPISWNSWTAVIRW